MATFRLYYEQTFFVNIDVEADSPEEARDLVEDNVDDYSWDWDPGEEVHLIEITAVDR